MLKVIAGKVTAWRRGTLYQGKVIHWSAEPTLLHHTPTRRSSVQETTKWIMARAEKVGAYRDSGENGSTTRMFVVAIQHGGPQFYNKDQLEQRVRYQMLRKNMGPDRVIDFGTARKIRGRVTGHITSIDYDRIEMMVTRLSYPGGDRIKREKPMPITLKLYKIQRIMYYR